MAQALGRIAPSGRMLGTCATHSPHRRTGCILCGGLIS